MDGEDSRPTHRDKAAMNGAQTYLFTKLKQVVRSMNGESSRSFAIPGP